MMADVEQLVRETLARHEAEVPRPDPLELRPVIARTRRRQGLNALGAGVVALVIALGAVFGIGALLEAEGPKPAIPQPTPPPSSFAPVALPPPDIEPSTHSTGKLIVSFSSEDVRAIPGESDEVERLVVNVYENGQVIWSRCIFESWTPEPRQRPNGDRCVAANTSATSELVNTGWVQQRLTSQAVQLLRTEVLSTGLFRHDVSVTSNSVANLAEYVSIDVRDGARMLSARADYQSLDINPPTRSQAASFLDAQEIFTDLGAWLPNTAWIDEDVEPFVPSSYTFWFKRDSVSHLLRDAMSVEVIRLGPQDLPDPANELLTREGCDVVTLDELRAVVDGFAKVGITVSAEMSSMDLIAYLVSDADPGAAVYFQPIVSGDRPSC